MARSRHVARAVATAAAAAAAVMLATQPAAAAGAAAAAAAAQPPSLRRRKASPRAPAAATAPAPAAAAAAATATCVLPSMRPAPAARTYVSPAVDALIASYLPRFIDPNLGTLFANALPNALDTTVYAHTPVAGSTAAAPADTFIITGDIEAMWLRDSTNQVLPYLGLAAGDSALRDLLVGLIGRQARSVLIDTYANAFQENALGGQGPHADDATYTTLFAGTVVSAMTPAVFERKWEVDSLANVLRLSAAYWDATGDASPFNATWVAAVGTILATFKAQQADTAQEDAAGGPAYTFQRTTSQPTDTLEQGRGFPVSYTGMIKTAFRASDDATIYNYNIPENAFAAVALRAVAPLLSAVNATTLAAAATALAGQVEAGMATWGTMHHPTAGTVWAYEVDGFGNAVFMDDANIPSLLAMPYYGASNGSDALYLATRAAVLSAANPWFLNGTAGAGVGGPHNGWPYIWPMSIIMRGWTAQSDAEIVEVLNTLVGTTACTGLMHESFNFNDATDFTRPWFAWANSLFGSFIMKLAVEKPYLIFNK